MNKSFTRDIFHSFKIIALAAVLALGVASASAAWTAPTATPPNNNTSQPINVGSVSQVKAGGLGITNLVADSLFSTGKSTAKEFCIDADGLGPIAPSCFSGYPTGGCTGSQEFTTPGTHTFIVPSCVTATTPLYLTAVGGGGGGMGGVDACGPVSGGGGGGASGILNKLFNKTGGTVLTVVVGAGGGPEQSGAATIVKENQTTLFSFGGGGIGGDNGTNCTINDKARGGLGGIATGGDTGGGGGTGIDRGSVPGGGTPGANGSGGLGGHGGRNLQLENQNNTSSVYSMTLSVAGGGGGSIFGIGGQGGDYTTAYIQGTYNYSPIGVDGKDALNRGAGGGGGGAWDERNTDSAPQHYGRGGRGGNGYVKITW